MSNLEQCLQLGTLINYQPLFTKLFTGIPTFSPIFPIFANQIF